MRLVAVMFALAGCNPILGVGDFTTAPPDSNTVSNTVIGTSIIDYIVFDGTILPAPEDLSKYTIKAYVPDGMGQFDVKVGVGHADGTFEVPDIPPGTTYYLYLLYPQSPNYPPPHPQFWETNARTLDLGYPVMGRPDGVEATRTSTVTFQLTNMTPWGDDLLLVDSYNNGSEFSDMRRVTNPPAAGATSVTSYSFDWRDGYTYHPIGSLPRLVESAKGDDLFVTQLHDEIVNQGRFMYQLERETGVLEKADVTQTDGSPVSVSGALTPITFDKTIAPSFSISAYRQSFAADGGSASFENLSFQRIDNAGAQYGQLIGTGPWLVRIPASTSTLTQVPTPFQLPPIMYGNSTLVPSTWGQNFYATYTRERRIRAPGALGGGVVSYSELARPSGSNVDFRPAIQPVQQIMINGIDTLTNTGTIPFDGTTGPIISWDAVTSAAGYLVRISRVYSDGGRTMLEQVFLAHTKSTSFTIPPTLIMKGQRYVVAVSTALGLDDTGLRRHQIPEATSQQFGAVFLFSDACGDGVVQPELGEECDTMGESAMCDSDCSMVLCGDATKNTAAGEMCDFGGDTLSCDSNCTPVACGDGYFNRTAEICDDGNTNNTDGCSNTCTRTGTCGDGFVQPSVEGCDPPNGTTCGPDCYPL